MICSLEVAYSPVQKVTKVRLALYNKIIGSVYKIPGCLVTELLNLLHTPLMAAGDLQG